MRVEEIILNILFYICAATGVMSALLVALSKNIVRTAFYLFFCLVAVAGFYGFLRADFLLVIQILIYVGGIMVLIIFAIMLVRKVGDIRASNESMPTAGALFTVLCVLFMILMIVFTTVWEKPAMPQKLEPLTTTLGQKLLGEYLLPFEIASVLLLIAIIGAVYIARKETKE